MNRQVNPRMDVTSGNWRISSRCTSAGCVEVATSDEVIRVRDSKNPAVAELRFDRAQWRAFLEKAKRGDYDI